MSDKRANFGSKLGMILATAGGAVGLGNVWRFPYMVGENGGAAFILIYLGCVLLLGIPCMVSEFIIGRHGASNTYRAYARVSGGKAWKFVGLLGVLTGFLITGYYAVVSGWCLQYIYASIMGELHGDSLFVQNYFTTFSTNPIRPIFWLAVILLTAHFVIIHGVRGGIERASKLLMPTLFILLLVIVVASCLLPGASRGIDFLLKPDFGKVDQGVFLGALGQSFYSLSIAMGCICTYASYYSRQTNLLASAIQVSVVDTMVAILAGLMIFPAAFSVGVNPDSGPSLIFITLPNVFNEAFGSMPVMGWVVSLMFYGLLSLAALTSLMSLHEVSTSFFYEELHISRKKGAVIVTVSTIIIGAFCSLSLGGMDYLRVAGISLFDAFDFVTGQIFLPVGGFLTCVFLGWFVPKKVVRDEFTNWGTLSARFFGIFLFLVRFVCPLAILAIFLHQLNVI
ncbi:sodium-dependent transporter [Hallella bergensis]|uniref:sodium-dependent transporter n=1 Tax=Hallella bergensis TaxID=242750 RepID=UPI00399083B4